MAYTQAAEKYIKLEIDLANKQIELMSIKSDISRIRHQLSDLSFKSLGLCGHAKVDKLKKERGILANNV